MILGAAIFVSVLFAAHFVRTWIAGHRPNPVKLGIAGHQHRVLVVLQ